MKNLQIIISILSVLLLVLAAFAGGGIKGKVTDNKSSEGFDGATVAVVDPETGIVEFSALTVDGGKFDLYGIPAGNWNLFITAIDYDTTFATIEIIDGEDLELDYSISEFEEPDDDEFRM